MATDSPILHIADYGQSIWMDNLTRDLVQSGELQKLIETRGLRGITSNPAIFEKAIAGNQIYDADIEAGVRAGRTTQEIYESLIFEDICNACDIFQPVFHASGGLDGYISIEVPPTIARDTQTTLAEARRYAATVGRENVMIKIPGTPEGLPAVEQAISEGINVNVTLLFSVQSYVDTAWAYIRGLEARAARGEDISRIASVASFFLSRIDSKVDKQVDQRLAATTDDATRQKLEGIKGKVAIANAKVAYQKYKEIIEGDRWQTLAAKGAKVQRLLWASTSTKDPAYSDVMYVDELIGPDTVNPLPPVTIEACADHCDLDNRIETGLVGVHQLMATLPEVGIDLEAVMEELLDEGITKFVQPYESLIVSLETKARQLVAA